MRASTVSRRPLARVGFAIGSYAVGFTGMPASSAASASVRSRACFSKYTRAAMLDSVGAVAEVDRVQVGGEDPVLRPAPLELPGEGCLLELPADRPLGLDVRVLDELLCDRRAALDDLLVAYVGPHGPEDAAQVDAAVLVEAPVLDRDDRLLHDRRDLVGTEDGAGLVAAQHRQDLSRRQRRCSRSARRGSREFAGSIDGISEAMAVTKPKAKAARPQSPITVSRRRSLSLRMRRRGRFGAVSERRRRSTTAGFYPQVRLEPT